MRSAWPGRNRLIDFGTELRGLRLELRVGLGELLVRLFPNPVEHRAFEALTLGTQAIALLAGLKAKTPHLDVELFALGGSLVLETERLELRTLDGLLTRFE